MCFYSEHRLRAVLEKGFIKKSDIAESNIFLKHFIMMQRASPS